MLSRSQALALLAGSLALNCAVPAAAADPGVEFFEKRIRPVLIEHCYECHSTDAEDLQGDLRVDTRDAIRLGGASGPAVVPGNPDESLLLSALRHEDFEMPPAGRLPEQVIRDFVTWIESGATDPREGPSTVRSAGIDIDAGRQFWSFQPIQRPSPPSVMDTDWPKNEIDYFILSRLERERIRPNPQADRRTLVRRLYFDLMGLPPTPQQIDAALADSSDDALARLVDRLLASPRFGAHWGRHWLDVVRYADSSGGGRTRILHDAWRFRDYVIDAFNSDLRYDVFLAEQIAGDLLPAASDDIRRRRLTATGFLALGPTNYELQDKELLRMEVVDEQIDTIGRVFLGMTIGCARCHDHKFDPIPTSDYYALAGVLRSTKTLIHANVSDFVERELPVDPEHRARLDAHADSVAQLNARLSQLKSKLKASTGSPSTRSIAMEQLSGIVVDDDDATLVGDWALSSHTPYFVSQGYRHDADQDKGVKEARFETTLPGDGEYEVRMSYSAGGNRSANVPVTVFHSDGHTVVEVDQTQTPPIGELFVSLGVFRFDASSSAVVQIRNQGTRGHVILDAVQFLPVDQREPTAESRDHDGNNNRLRQLKREIAHVEADLKTVNDQAPRPAPKVMSVMEEDDPSDFRICIRGNVHNLGAPVPRGFLKVADHVDRWDLPADESGRRELAEWMTHPRHPLVARVMVNRVWHHLLGSGLARTPDNFGRTGEEPSHPLLLDYLATELVRQNWSIKALVRQIVASKTYQLSSSNRPEAAALDAENRWYWRAKRKRLTAEQIHDAILLCSGQLDERMGGPSVDPQVDSEFEYQFSGNRRAVYLPVFRNQLMDVLEVFDVADPNLVVGRRNVSTRPTQALFLLNSPFVLRQAERLSEESAARAFEHQDARVDWLFLRTLGRPPTQRERARTIVFVNDLCATGRVQPAAAWTAVAQSLLACVDFRYIR